MKVEYSIVNFILLIAFIFGLMSGVIIMSLTSSPEKEVQNWKTKYEEQKTAYLKANTLLKYHDSINNSGLIINLSKYQLEYVKREIDKIK